MHFVYVGDPLDNGDGPAVLEMFGGRFVKDGSSVDISDPGAVRKLSNNRHFVAGMAFDAVAVDVTPAEDTTTDPRADMWRAAELNGVTIDKRWGVPKLRATLLAAGVIEDDGDGDAS